MEEDLLTKQYKIALENMKNELEEFDEKFFLSHDENKYKVANYRERAITTEFGYLVYKRRQYTYKTSTGKIKRFIPVDEHFGLGSRCKIHPSLKMKILKQAGSGKRYRDILDMFPEANLTTMTISRIFRESNFIDKMDKVKEKVALEKGQIIYINTDDTYANVFDSKIHKTRTQRFRVVSFHLGYENEQENRKKLKDKRTFFIDDKNDAMTAEQTARELFNWLDKFYINWENAKLVVGGDGATWIKNVALSMGAEYVLDNFHAQSYLLKAFNINKHNPKQNIQNYNLYRVAYTYFLNGRWDDLMVILKESKVPSEIKSYFRHNKRGVESWSKSWCIGVSAESDCSRLIKSTLGYGAKLFNVKTLYNMIGAKAYKINNYGTY